MQRVGIPRVTFKQTEVWFVQSTDKYNIEYEFDISNLVLTLLTIMFYTCIELDNNKEDLSEG